MKIRFILFALLSMAFVENCQAQMNFDLTKANGNYIATGSESVSGSERATLANALMWAIGQCETGKELITSCDYKAQTFTMKLTLAADEASKEKYTCTLKVRIASGQIVLLVEDIKLCATTFIGENITPLERLNPEKKPKHKDFINEFARLNNKVLNDLMASVKAGTYNKFSHWNEICAGNVTKGMVADEVRIILGNPTSVTENPQRMQWMYSGGTYVIFENGVVTAFLN